MSSSYRAAERINDLFMISLSDLESSIVSNIIKSSGCPTRLIEETQQTINDYKQRFYGSLIQLITYISQQISMNPKELQKIAESLEQELIKYKQKHLLFQMKAMLSTKIKALLDTLNYESMGQNTNRCEIQSSVKTLTDSLTRIEKALQCAPVSPDHITPIQLRQERSSVGLTPNLSDEAENKVKATFVTPRQGNVLLQVPNVQTPLQHSPQQTSGLQNRTINSFNEHEGGLQHHHPLGNVHDYLSSLMNMEFKNEFMEPEMVQSIEVKKKSTKKQTNYSAHSIPIQAQTTPSERKKFNSTKTKELMKRNQQMPESVNLLSKLNQAEEKKKKAPTTMISRKNSNKENARVGNRQQQQQVKPTTAPQQKKKMM